MVAGHPAFEKAQRLLDLGGGHGLYAIALRRLKPTLVATVFDLPHVEAVTREYASRYRVPVDFYGGDFYSDELPGEQDIILAFDVFYGTPAKTKGVLAQDLPGAKAWRLPFSQALVLGRYPYPTGAGRVFCPPSGAGQPCGTCKHLGRDGRVA